MSTKTTFKRIALVAVAALGLSIVSVAPSGASVNADSLNHFKAATCSEPGTIGATNVATTAQSYADCANYNAETTNVLINGTAVYGLAQSFIASNNTDAATVTVRLIQNAYNGAGYAVDGIAAYSVPGVLPVVTRGSYANHNNANVTQTLSTDGLTVTNTAAAAGSVTGAMKVTFTPVLRGTYVITFTPQTGSLASVHTWTVNAYATQAELDTANGVDNAISAAQTTSILNAGETSTATADATVVVSKDISTDARATIVVTPKNAAGTATSATFPLTATISGPGSLRIGASVSAATTSAAGRAVTGATGEYYVGVFSDGNTGVATVTISSGTTVLATETVTFYGAAASYTATVAKNVIPMGTTTAAVISVVAKDKDGNVVPSQTLKMTSSDTTVVADVASVTSSTAAEATAGTATVGVTGAAAKFGKVTLTFSDSTATIAATATAVVTLSSTTATTVSAAFDKTEYTPGAKMTLVVTAKDVNGLPVAPMDPIATLSANTSLSAFPAAFDTLTTDGSVSYTMYAPLVAGPITVTGTDSNTVAAVITASTSVVSDGLAQAAVDAAEEAIAAAEAATEAALTAAEAADAATTAAQDASDAVATLATQVTEQINALKAQNTALKSQITSLTNLIIKIQKKIGA